MDRLEEIIRANPQINQQLPTPRVIESTDDVINLDEPFTLELPPIDTSLFGHVLLLFVNAEGGDSPHDLAFVPAVADQPATHIVDNDTLSPPFTRDHTAVLKAYVQDKITLKWQRTPDSVIYAF